MQNEFGSHGADLLAVAECCDRDRAIHIPKLRRFQQRERRNTLARSQFKCVSNQSVIFVAANLYLIGIVLAIVDELGFYAGFSDQSI